MTTIRKKWMGLLFSVIVLSAVSAFAQEVMTGKLISANPSFSTIDVDVNVMGLAGPMTKEEKLDLAADVKWLICLGGSCAEKYGIEGQWMLQEYSQYEAYGINVQGSDVTMVKTGDAITEIKVNLL